MTTSHALLALSFLSLATAACEPVLVGSHEVTTLNPAADGFERLEFSNEVDATVVQGPVRRVEITINENLQEQLRVRTAGSRLEIGMDEGYDYHRLTLQVRVTMPALTAIELSGASRARLDGFDRAPTPRLDATASGASHLSAQVVADRLALDLSGASDADVSGTTRELSLVASGASHARLDALAATSASIDLSGASHATVWVDSEVHGEASGASELLVRGTASMNIATSGASSVSRR
jgi:hypothetical protein